MIICDISTYCHVGSSTIRSARLQVSDLAALIGWERSRMSRQLRRLCERGLAERVASEHDGRATDTILTKAGRAAIEAAAPGYVAFVRRMFFDPLPGELLAPLTEALEHVYVNINFKLLLAAGSVDTCER